MNAVPVETPQAAARRLSARMLQSGYDPAGLHEYCSADGTPTFWRIRCRHPDTGDKWIRPMHWNGAGYAIGEPAKPEAGSLLYRLPELLADTAAPVWVVESETCADALAKVGKLATTSGSSTTAEGADWLPLKGRSVTVWPDYDGAGTKYADAVTARLRALGCDVRRVDSGALGLPEKGDCVDWLRSHSADALDKLPLVQDARGMHEPSRIARAREETDHLPRMKLVRGDPPLLDVETFVRRFCALPSEADYVAVTLWAAHAHMVEHFHTTPRLALLSPEPGSGKTRVLEILELLTPNTLFAFSASVPAIFRTLADRQTTLLFDEVDTVFGRRGKDDQNEDLRALLNAGYRRGAKIPRCVGPQHEVRQFDVFAAVALAGLGDLPDTVMTRSVIVRMRRRAPSEHLESFRARTHEPQGHALRDRLAMWAEQVGKVVGNAEPELPAGIVDRPAEVWEPLVAVADAAGGDWPARARAACVAICGAAGNRAVSLGVRLLADLRTVFGEATALSTERILEVLKGDSLGDAAPWATLRGEGLDARGLARLLNQYGVQSAKVWIGAASVRGYKRADLWDSWERYCPAVTSPEAEGTEEVEGMEGAGLHPSATSALSAAKDPTGGQGASEEWVL